MSKERTLQRIVVTIFTSCFKINKLCISSPQCVGVFSAIIIINSDYFTRSINRLFFLMNTPCFLLSVILTFEEYLDNLYASNAATSSR
jgi:hypothetical protein